MISIPIEEQDSILEYLLKTPPEDYIEECNTTDRLLHLMECKIFHLSLHDFFKCHFSGKELEVTFFKYTDNELLGKIFEAKIEDNNFIQNLGLFLDYYLAIYAVISWGWKDIEKTLSESQEEIPKSPGDALIRIINDFFHGILSVYFPEEITGNFYKKYSPRKQYNFKRKKAEISKLENRSTPLSKKEEKLVNNYRKEVVKKASFAEPFLWRMQLYIDICTNNKVNDKTMERRLENFKKVARELSKKINQNMHPSKRRKGYAISKGVRLQGRKEGGTYS